MPSFFGRIYMYVSQFCILGNIRHCCVAFWVKKRHNGELKPLTAHALHILLHHYGGFVYISKTMTSKNLTLLES